MRTAGNPRRLEPFVELNIVLLFEPICFDLARRSERKPDFRAAKEFPVCDRHDPPIIPDSTPR
jgi:hypothetical protein